ncbi:MAG: B12-binding domain-containing radical SAM protein [Clostridia bacterium]|nr:B12-binding domain-containing radical SAM protein [Clostridia bacterium]
MKNKVYLVTFKPTSHRTAEENLGLQYLAAVLEKEGYKGEIRDAWLDETLSQDSIFSEIESEKENILFVATSSYMLNNKTTCDFISNLSRQNINVVAGGYGPTFEPEQFLRSGAGFVVIGEGEETILDIAKFYEEGKIDKTISGTAYLDENSGVKLNSKRQIQTSLDDLPLPKRPYIKTIQARRSTVNVLTSRGCNGVCKFCSICAFLTKQNSKRWRCRSIDSIILELKHLKEQGCRTIKFIDDSFIEEERDETWCENFLKATKESGLDLQYRGSIRADKVNAKSMKFLRQAGFFSFSCGIENGSKTALKRMGKLASLEDNKKALKIFKKNKFFIQAGFILFDNKTTIQELEENYKFLKSHNWVVSKGIFSEMFAAVGTPFTKSLSTSGETYFSNNIYQVEDEDARKCYNILKKWQAHHSEIYDMVIDPVSAPKDINKKEMKKYCRLMIQMKKVDLKFMKETLRCIKAQKSLDELFFAFENKYKIFFQNIEKKAKEYYKKDNLVYDGNINGFLKNNIQ